MKILYHHRTRGKGVERVHIKGIVDGLIELGHEVHILSPSGVTLIDIDKKGEEVKKESILSRMWDWLCEHLPQTVFEILEILYNLFAYKRIHNKLKRYDFIYERYAFFCFVTSYLAKRHNIPFMIEVNEVAGLKRARGQVLVSLSKLIERKIFNNADAIIVVSDFLKDKILDMGISADKVWVLPNAVNPQKFSPVVNADDLKRRLGVNGKFILGFIGSFEYWHNFGFLLAAFREIVNFNPNVQLILVGDGPAKNFIKQSIANMQLEDYVIFTGTVDHHVIPEYISLMDIGLIPHSNEYRSPVKLFEYMAMKKVVIAPRLKPIQSIVKDNENGILFEPEDISSFRNAVQRIIQDSNQRKKIGESARETIINNYTWEKNTDRVLSIYNNIENNRYQNNRSGGFKIPILLYHDIKLGNPELDRNDIECMPYVLNDFQFEKQIEYLFQKKFRTISLHDLILAKSQYMTLPPKSIVITFDDGHISNYLKAYPILKKYGFSATFFITVGFIGKPKMLTWSQIKEMLDNGMEIGSHTMNHPFPITLSTSELEYELLESKRILEAELGTKIDSFSVPSGIYNQETIRIARKTGYHAVCVNSGRLVGNNIDLMELPRLDIKRNMSFSTFTKVVNMQSNAILLNRIREQFLESCKNLIGLKAYNLVRKNLLSLCKR